VRIYSVFQKKGPRNHVRRGACSDEALSEGQRKAPEANAAWTECNSGGASAWEEAKAQSKSKGGEVKTGLRN